MSDQTEAEKQAALRELDRQIAIRNASLSTGVPAGMLANATSEAEANAIAAAAIAWKGAGASAAPAPQTAAVPALSVAQYTRNNLGHMSPQQIQQAYQAGKLEAIGGMPSPDRRNGAQA